MKRSSIIAISLLTFAGLAAAASPPVPPPSCASAEYHQFDFWIGDWAVAKPNGTFAGTNRVTQEYGGCVIHEHYVTGKGYSGESLNMYDAARKVWHQTWVDDNGLVLLLDGRWDGKSMVLEGLAPNANGVVVKQRITFTPNVDGSVRQLWESQDAKGAWTVAFDGKYTKK